MSLMRQPDTCDSIQLVPMDDVGEAFSFVTSLHFFVTDVPVDGSDSSGFYRENWPRPTLTLNWSVCVCVGICVLRKTRTLQSVVTRVADRERSDDQ